MVAMSRSVLLATFHMLVFCCSLTQASAQNTPVPEIPSSAGYQYPMSMQRALAHRKVLIDIAKQQYDQNMFLANRAERDAQIARSVQNMAGYDTHMQNAIKHRNAALHVQSEFTSKISQIDHQLRSDFLRFSIFRLQFDDTDTISRLLTNELRTPTVVKATGELRGDERTYILWRQEGGRLTSIIDPMTRNPKQLTAPELSNLVQQLTGLH